MSSGGGPHRRCQEKSQVGTTFSKLEVGQNFLPNLEIRRIWTKIRSSTHEKDLKAIDVELACCNWANVVLKWPQRQHLAWRRCCRGHCQDPTKHFHPHLLATFFWYKPWPDKELMITETYHDELYAFFRRIALEDPWLKYIAIKVWLEFQSRVLWSSNVQWGRTSAYVPREVSLLASGEYCVNFGDK